MATSEILNTTPECEIITTRVFAFSRQLANKAWTDSDHIKKWWGPNGFTNTFHTFDLRMEVWDRQFKPISGGSSFRRSN